MGCWRNYQKFPWTHSCVYGKFWSFFQEHICDVTHGCWRRSKGFQFITKVFHVVEVRIRCRPDKFMLNSPFSLWILLVICVTTGRSSSPNWSQKVGSLGWLKHKEFLSLEIRAKSNLKNYMRTVPPPPNLQHCSPGNGPTPTRSSDWQMCHSHLHSSRALAALYTPDSYAFHCT